MVDSQRGSRAVLAIDGGDLDPRTAVLLHDELRALVKRTASDIGIDAPVFTDTSPPGVVLGFVPRPTRRRGRVDEFLDALATALDARNSGLDLDERLRLVVTVDSAGTGPDRAAASPLSARVLEANPAASLVIEATGRWYAAAGAPDTTYHAVTSRQDEFWLRVPGRSTIPGLTPTDLRSSDRRDDAWARIPPNRPVVRLGGANRRLDAVVSRAVERAATEGWISELVTTAFLADTARDPATPWSGTTLERIFRTAAAFQDVRPFTSRLLAVAARVCQVRVGAGGGTGFLVGPDLVLTNQHVVVDVIDGALPLSALRCVFDHHVGDDGLVHEGVAFASAGERDWLVDSSPPGGHGDPTRPPTTGELDFALLRLAEPAGLTTSSDGRERRWINLFDPAPELTHHLPLLILQHPLGHPMKLAMADKGVDAVLGGGTRVTYEVNTEHGSSGSPCLTFDLQLVALHQSGAASHNVGIPTSTIAAHLGEAGRTALRGT